MLRILTLVVSYSVLLVKVERQLKGRASVVTIGLVRQFQPRGTPFVSKSDFAHALKSFRVDIDSEVRTTAYNLQITVTCQFMIIGFRRLVGYAG